MQNGFSRTTSLKQPNLENNFSENNFSPTARTNCADEPRIPSLRTPSPSSCSHVHIAERVLYPDCAEKWFCCASSTLCAHRVWSTLIKSRTGPVHTQYHGTRLAKSVDTDFTFAVCTDNPLQTTQCICAVVIAHMGYTHLFRERRRYTRTQSSRELWK